MIFDPERKVLLYLFGDDVFKVVFGRVRMIGGHSPNVDVEELKNRYGSALRPDAVFDTSPQWEQQPRRLRLNRNRDVDHLSPQNWRGELRAVTCDLQGCWKEGVTQAESILKKSGYIIDFSNHFRNCRTRGVDLLRPKGGKYLGISSEVDRSLGELAEKQEEITDDFSFRLFDGKKALEAGESVGSQGMLYSIWMGLEEGRPPVRKNTALRLAMDPTLDIDYGSSHDRLLRVRTFSIGGDHWDRSKLQIYQPSSGDLFTLESLYATAICIEQKVSIAILQCTSLKSASQYLDCAPLEEIPLPRSNYDVSGQILPLRPISVDAETLTS